MTSFEGEKKFEKKKEWVCPKCEGGLDAEGRCKNQFCLFYGEVVGVKKETEEISGMKHEGQQEKTNVEELSQTAKPLQQESPKTKPKEESRRLTIFKKETDAELNKTAEFYIKEIERNLQFQGISSKSPRERFKNLNESIKEKVISDIVKIFESILKQRDFTEILKKIKNNSSGTTHEIIKEILEQKKYLL